MRGWVGVGGGVEGWRGGVGEGFRRVGGGLVGGGCVV